LPAGVIPPTTEPASANETPQSPIGGPPSNSILGGMFTGIGTILLICLGSVLFLGVLVGIGALVVSALRKK
jgi:hypothetical protein